MKTTAEVHNSCPNCGHGYISKFCANCGQKNKNDDSLKSILSDVGNVIWGADSRFFRTLKDYITPGVYLKNWLSGKRARYISPVKFFLLINLIYFLLLSFGGLNTFVNSFDSQTQNQFYSEAISEFAYSHISGSGYSFEQFEQIYNSRVFNISNTLILIVALIFAVHFFLLNIRKSHYFYESLISGIYLGGYLLIFSTIVNLVVEGLYFIYGDQINGRLLDEAITLSMASFLSAIAYYIQKKLYQESTITALIKAIILGFPLSFFTVLLYRFLLFWITYYSVFLL